MDKKLLLASSVLIILLITFSSAGWFSDFFNKPDLSPVDIDLELENSPPTIKRLFIPSSLGPQYAQPYTANPGTGFGVFYVGIVVEDANGPSDLLQGTSLPPTSSAYFEINSPANSVNPSLVRSVLSCDSYLCSHPTLGSNCDNPSRQLMYVCGGPFLPSDPPSSYSGTSPNANDLWRIRAAAVDLVLNPSGIVTSGDPGFNSLPESYMQINELSAYNIANPSLSWSSLSITTPNQVANSPLTIENYGNIPLTSVNIIGQDLTGTNPINPTAVLRVEAFKASGLAGQESCGDSNTAQLGNGAEVPVPEVSIPYTSAGPSVDRDQMYICAFETLNTMISGPSSISYGGTWDVIAA